MALFKISKGKSNNLPTNKVDGYCYVTTNDHKFYVDYTKEDGTLDRFALNAVYADTAGALTTSAGSSTQPIYFNNGKPVAITEAIANDITGNAATATKATQDGNGNIISSTYLPLSAGQDKKLTGPLGLTENINYGTSLPDNGFDGQLFFLEDDSPSLPIGGTAGQVLTKNSSEDGDASWTTDIAGNAATATKLATARTISLTGDITGSGSFDGSDNLSITTTKTSPALPTGGTTGQVLVKNSSTDGDASWVTDISGNAATATKATQDGNGNTISSTYLPLSGGTMTGNINMTKATKLNSYSTSITQTAVPSSATHYEPIQWYDKDNKRIGAIGTTYYTNGDLATHIQVQREIDGVNKYQQLYMVLSADGTGFCKTTKIYGAVWNDYAEFRICKDNFKPGQVVCENNDDTLSISTYRLQPGANIVSDTYGFAIGETDEAKCPIAVSGRVLTYTYEPREEFNAGDAVCAGPNGTVSKMTREEIKEYPERIIGTVSAVPNYETWGSGNVPVNGRIWIKVR